MGWATVSTSDRVSRRRSLVWRILAVNLFALAMLAGGIVYLDSYRGRLIDQRRSEVEREARTIALALSAEADLARGGRGYRPLARALGRSTGFGLMNVVDGLSPSVETLAPAPAIGRDPAREPLRRRVAYAIDRTIDWFAGAPAPPRWPGDPAATLAWPTGDGAPEIAAPLWRASDGALVVTTLVPVRAGIGGPPIVSLHVIADARDITFSVRDERLRAFRIFLGVLALSALLSIYLARTIARPLELLAVAAGRVKSGRAREVEIPRFDRRGDEIGQLARAVAEMSAALRLRIDATEAFAADVAHELRNPLASLRSALETFERVADPAARAELGRVMIDDVARLDRLIGGIAEASRLEAEISRARFTRVDLVALAVTATRDRPGERGVTLVVEGEGAALGDARRLAQVAANLIDNAAGFSPDGGRVRLSVASAGGWATLAVEDEGPGVPPENMTDIFRRFYTSRPESDAFARHSGLGLAIARAIVEAHGGALSVENRSEAGARFTMRLPAA